MDLQQSQNNIQYTKHSPMAFYLQFFKSVSMPAHVTQSIVWFSFAKEKRHTEFTITLNNIYSNKNSVKMKNKTTNIGISVSVIYYCVWHKSRAGGMN